MAGIQVLVDTIVRIPKGYVLVIVVRGKRVSYPYFTPSLMLHPLYFLNRPHSAENVVLFAS